MLVQDTRLPIGTRVRPVWFDTYLLVGIVDNWIPNEMPNQIDPVTGSVMPYFYSVTFRTVDGGLENLWLGPDDVIVEECSL